jgi:hypothetical protein
METAIYRLSFEYEDANMFINSAAFGKIIIIIYLISGSFQSRYRDISHDLRNVI